MLLEATIAMFVLMGITWAGAIWASNRESRINRHQSWTLRYPAKMAA